MKKNATKIYAAWSVIIISLALMVLVAGCGSEGVTTGADAGITSGGGMVVAGVGVGGTGVIKSAAADSSPPVLIAACVFLDKNGNRLPDPGEPGAITDANGDYTLQLDPAEAAAYPLLIQAVAGSTIVKATGQLVSESYVTEMKPK